MEDLQLVETIQQEHPLIHNMTNLVVANFVANGLLALGAAPIMANAIEEVGEIAAQANCLVLNIGTITASQFESMLVAGKAANQKGIPVVLDPVGVGASVYRQKVVSEILARVDVSLIRGNSGELAALGGIDWQSRGVDAGTGAYDLSRLAKEVAEKYACAVAISGEVDYISDGIRQAEVRSGSPLMTKVTGMGCLLSSVCGAFIASGVDVFTSTVAAHRSYALVGETVAEAVTTPGTFQMLFIDQLTQITRLLEEE